ncbi:thioredoxin [Lachnospiraceae bacterium OttesenSCG-928-D06]|nr:thioredoxin [Lachnospiraceae bacterium OttesenSCG-928-D06]
MAFNLTTKTFETEVLSQSGKVLIDFWAPWCGPCRMLGPVIDELSNELEGRVRVYKVNIDEEPELASRYGVMSIPTLVAMNDGKVSKQMVGVQPKISILKMFE